MFAGPGRYRADLASLPTRQLRFLAACSYVPCSARGFARQKQQLEDSLSGNLDPGALLAGIDRHRIFALAERVLREHGLEHVLGDLHPAFQARARQCHLQSLRLLSASVQLSASLSEAGIAHHFLKGPHLSQKIYGDPSLRHSKDLDLMAMPKQIALAVDVLQLNGWELRHGAMWLKGGVYRRIAECRLRDLMLFHQQKKVSLELHWRIEAARSPYLEEKWWSLWHDRPSELSHAETLYLCLHGAGHAWARLKWLGDLAAIIDRQPELWHASQEISTALGLELAVAQTILLLQLLFGVEPDATATRILNRQPQAHVLAAFSLRAMQDADIYRKQSVCEMWAQRRYSASFETRYSFFDRFVYRASFLAGLPLARLTSLLNGP